MKTVYITYSFMALTLLLNSNISRAESAANTLLNIQRQWASCQYQVSGEDLKTRCLENNIIANEKALDAAADKNELKVWLAINMSSLAGVKGGLGALSLVKKARKLLQQVIASDPEVLEGSAYTSLGSLYYQVPGWPIGFGNDDKAEKMLKKALVINPLGIDPNYFYADFLKESGKNKEAVKYFKQAQAAPPRPTRPLADQGRLQEINNKLKELN